MHYSPNLARFPGVVCSLEAKHFHSSYQTPTRTWVAARETPTRRARVNRTERGPVFRCQFWLRKLHQNRARSKGNQLCGRRTEGGGRKRRSAGARQRRREGSAPSGSAHCVRKPTGAQPARLNDRRSVRRASERSAAALRSPAALAMVDSQNSCCSQARSPCRAR